MNESPSLTDLSEIEELLSQRLHAEARERLQGLRESLDPDRVRLEDGMLDAMEAECNVFLGAYAEGAAQATRLATVFRLSGEHAIFARAHLICAIADYFQGRLDESLEHCQVALFSYKRVDEHIGVIRSFNWLGNISFDRGDYAHALKSYGECARLAKIVDSQRWVAVARLNMILPLALSGRLQEAARLSADNRALLAEHGDSVNLLRNDLMDAYVSLGARRFDDARMILSAIQSGKSAGLCSRDEGALYEYLGELELSCGNLGEAEAHLSRSIAIASGDNRDESVIGQSLRLLSEVRLAQGRHDEALADGEEALVSIRRVGERFEEGIVYRVFGVIHAQRGNVNTAREYHGRSIEILRAIDARLEWAKSALAAGRCGALSRRERLSHLLEAERLFREVGVDFWIADTERELADLTEPTSAKAAVASKPSTNSPAVRFITEDNETREIIQLSERLARTNLVVLITGETGAGKDHLAAHIHAVSGRSHKPFVEIDLSTIPDSLWESELFGHRRGAYTGASGDKTGLFESANGGTVFLNEIGNLPSHMQVKLLEFLDTRQIRRIGDTHPITLDIRLIAATNTPLRDAVKRGTFRADLLHRLEEAPIHLRPLRERRADIVPLIRHFLREAGISPSEIASIDDHCWINTAQEAAWPGNTRQLRNFVLRLAGVADRPSHPEFESWAVRLLEQMRVNDKPESHGAVSPERLRAALDLSRGNQRAAARELGITEAGVRHLMRRFGFTRHNDGDELGEKVAA